MLLYYNKMKDLCYNIDLLRRFLQTNYELQLCNIERSIFSPLKRLFFNNYMDLKLRVIIDTYTEVSKLLSWNVIDKAYRNGNLYSILHLIVDNHKDEIVEFENFNRIGLTFTSME